MSAQWEKRLYAAGFAAPLLALALYGLLMRAEKRGLGHCVFYELTGWYCPGCGGTRAVKALLAGRLWRSFCCHPLVLYCFVIWLLFMLTHSAKRIWKGFPFVFELKIRHLVEAAALLGVQWIFKNIALHVWHLSLL